MCTVVLICGLDNIICMLKTQPELGLGGLDNMLKLSPSWDSEVVICRHPFRAASVHVWKGFHTATALKPAFTNDAPHPHKVRAYDLKIPGL